MYHGDTLGSHRNGSQTEASGWLVQPVPLTSLARPRPACRRRRHRTYSGHTSQSVRPRVLYFGDVHALSLSMGNPSGIGLSQSAQPIQRHSLESYFCMSFKDSVRLSPLSPHPTPSEITSSDHWNNHTVHELVRAVHGWTPTCCCG
jgi:hypothetical protein